MYIYNRCFHCRYKSAQYQIKQVKINVNILNFIIATLSFTCIQDDLQAIVYNLTTMI